MTDTTTQPAAGPPETPNQVVVILGVQDAAQHATGRDDADQPVYEPHPGRHMLVVSSSERLMDALTSITAPVRGIWAQHTQDPPEGDPYPTPAWVESNVDAAAMMLAAHWGCPVGRPDDWVNDDADPTPAPPAAAEEGNA